MSDGAQYDGDIIEDGDTVAIIASGEIGTCNGFKYIGDNEPEFWVEYVDNAGCAQARWWQESALRKFSKANVINLADYRKRLQ